MANENQEEAPRIAWKFSKARDVLTLWGESGESPKRIEVSGVMVRQLTGGRGFDDLPAHTLSYILNLLYSRPGAYGGKVVSGGQQLPSERTVPTLCGGAQRDFLVRMLGLEAEGNAPVKVFARYGFDGTFRNGSLLDIDLLVPEAFLRQDRYR